MDKYAYQIGVAIKTQLILNFDKTDYIVWCTFDASA